MEIRHYCSRCRTTERYGHHLYFGSSSLLLLLLFLLLSHVLKQSWTHFYVSLLNPFSFSAVDVDVDALVVIAADRTVRCSILLLIFFVAVLVLSVENTVAKNIPKCWSLSETKCCRCKHVPFLLRLPMTYVIISD